MAVDCVCAGILVADHLCEPIEKLPAAGELVLSDALPLEIGGCASNVAIDLSRLGAKVGVIGCVGNDPFGRFVIETLSGAGTDTAAIRQIDDVGTSGTLIINVTGEDRRFIHAIGANARFAPEDLQRPQVDAAKVLYLGGYLLMPNLEPRRLRERLRAARRAGVKTVVDVVLPGEGDHMAALEPVLSETDVFLPNHDEAAAITGHADPVRQAETFLEAGAGTVVITQGTIGTLLMSNDLRLRAATYPVEFVGGTGAGDAFDAGYIAGLLEGAEPRRCLQWGSALGASCVRAIGATQSVLTRNQAEAWINEKKLEITSF